MITSKHREREYVKTAYRSEDVDVLVSGDQMGAFGDACSRLKLVPRQHPDLSRKQVKHASEPKMWHKNQMQFN